MSNYSWEDWEELEEETFREKILPEMKPVSYIYIKSDYT